MLDSLNKINLAAWRENPNVAIEIARTIENASWQKSPFAPFMGRGQDRGVRTYNVKDSNPYRPRLKAQLTGDGVRGNADFETNFDNLEILSQTVYPLIIGNSIKSPVKQYTQIEQIDFIKEATESLTDWIQDKRDRAFITALTNDLSNVVVCDKNGGKGYKDTTNETSVIEASKRTVKGDVCNVKALRRAIFMARSGINYKNKEAFPIKPIRSNMHSVGGIEVTNYSYLILLDTYQANQLKNDPEWIAMQKVGVRGEKNNLFTGLVGLVDECPVIDMGVWTKMQVGLLNSEISDSDFISNINEQNVGGNLTPPSAYANGQAVSIGFLIGASALVMVGSDTPSFYIDESQDAGRKVVCGVDRLMAIAKAKFENASGRLSPYANTDFSTIGIISSKE